MKSLSSRRPVREEDLMGMEVEYFDPPHIPHTFYFFDIEMEVYAPEYLQKWFVWAEKSEIRPEKRWQWNTGPWVARSLYEAMIKVREFMTDEGLFSSALEAIRRLAQEYSKGLPTEDLNWAHDLSHRCCVAWLDWATWKVILSGNPREIMGWYGQALRLPWRDTRKGNLKNAGADYQEYGEAFFYFRQAVGIQLKRLDTNWTRKGGWLKRDRRLRKLFWELEDQTIEGKDLSARHESGVRKYNRHNQPATRIEGWWGGIHKESGSQWYRAYIVDPAGESHISPFRFQHTEMNRWLDPQTQTRPLPHGHLIPVALYSEGQFWGIEFNYVSNETRIWGWEVRLESGEPVFSRYRRNPGNPPEDAIRQGDVWLIPTFSKDCFPEATPWRKIYYDSGNSRLTSSMNVDERMIMEVPEKYRTRPETRGVMDEHWNWSKDESWHFEKKGLYVQGATSRYEEDGTNGKIKHPDHPTIIGPGGTWYKVVEVGGSTTPQPRGGAAD